MAKFFPLLAVLALVLPVRSCIPTQGPDEDEWWDELSPTTSLLLQYSTLPIEQSTSTAAATASTSTAPTTTTTVSTTSTTTSTTTSSTTTTTSTLPCLDAQCIFNSATGRCYRAFTAPLGWFAAENNCMTFGAAHLASIGDQTEQDYVYTMVLTPIGIPGGAWYIGLIQVSDSTELMGMSDWTDMTPYDNGVWTNWNTTPPPFSVASQCIYMRVLTGTGEGKWDYQDCANTGIYVCEMAGTP